MARVSGTTIGESRRLLVGRAVASHYLSKIVRPRDLPAFLCEHGVDGDVHEQEVGHKVFGRARDYETSSDNIVRVHASQAAKDNTFPYFEALARVKGRSLLTREAVVVVCRVTRG